MAATSEIEEGLTLLPKFDADGLVTAVATDAATGELLMVAHMNEEALAKTIASGEAHYFSRSRRKLWRKGEESGHTQRVVEMRVDCDQDAVWLRWSKKGRVPVTPDAGAASIARCRSGRPAKRRWNFASRRRSSIRPVPIGVNNLRPAWRPLPHLLLSLFALSSFLSRTHIRQLVRRPPRGRRQWTGSGVF